ncbi:MAG: tRNA (guanosine(37)-N1)-methyltransferase TrmD, partial [Bacteroidota bacterium]|nr:tRNA (guanosine(37)-N1)-methyltransferase TrmD [Bacteroidota bacterium]
LVGSEMCIRDSLTGGELPAAVITDAIVRLLPGAISDAESALSDSFQDGLLAPPQYTRPAEFNGWKVPDILIGGNTPEIEKWRFEESLRITHEKRPDLLGEET